MNEALFVEELDAMRQLHHPNIVQFLGFATLPQPAIVMELFPNLSLEGGVGMPIVNHGATPPNEPPNNRLRQQCETAQAQHE